MLNKLLLFLSLIFVSNTYVYSFYDIYGDMPFRYSAVFTGSIIVSSAEFNYTNHNVSFYSDYAVTAQSEFSTPTQMIVDWTFSKIHSQGLPFIVDTILNGIFAEQVQDISYIVKVEGDPFWTFDKQGERSLLGHYLESLFPIVNTNKRPYRHTFNIPNKQKDTISIMIQGGDYGSYDFSENPSVLIQPNDPFISKFYTRYHQYYHSNIPTLFWSQQMHIRHLSPYNRLKTDAEILGLYFIDLQKKIVQQALLRVNLKTSVPYKHLHFNQQFDILLDGHFDITLLSE